MSAADLRPRLQAALSWDAAVFMVRYGMSAEVAERCVADVRKIAGGGV
jgi:hypothetical protein